MHVRYRLLPVSSGCLVHLSSLFVLILFRVPVFFNEPFKATQPAELAATTLTRPVFLVTLATIWLVVHVWLVMPVNTLRLSQPPALVLVLTVLVEHTRPLLELMQRPCVLAVLLELTRMPLRLIVLHRVLLVSLEPMPMLLEQHLRAFVLDVLLEQHPRFRGL